MLSDCRNILMISTHGYVSGKPEFGKPDTGGQVVYVLELSKHLGRLGFEVDIFTRQFEDQPEEEELAERVRLFRAPCGGKAFIPKETLCEHIPEWVTNAIRSITRHRRSYAFINSHYWDAGLAGQALAGRLGVPHVHTPHSIGAWKRDNMDGDPDDLERKYNFKRRIRDERIIYHESDLVLATTPLQRDILVGAEYDLDGRKIDVIPPGYDDTRFFPVSTATRRTLKRELGLEGPMVLALGRMAHNKGYDLLIRAMIPVIERVPSARLLLAVGSTSPSPREREQIADLRELADRLGLGERVLFHDYIPDEKLPDYYRAADVFALCSRYEPFGMTAVEAMACGTPTVITTEGGLWQQVAWGAEAMCANPFDPPAFGHAIAHILQYEHVPDLLAAQGARKARARFTWTGIASQLLKSMDDMDTEVSLAGGRDTIGPRSSWALNPAELEALRA